MTTGNAGSPLAMPAFTCLSCSIAFRSAEDQRLHYRSDHHRYNLKRRMASLPPVSEAVFQQKALERRAHTIDVPPSTLSFCESCKKSYVTENAYRSHLNSKKHKEAELKETTIHNISSTGQSLAPPSLGDGKKSNKAPGFVVLAPEEPSEHLIKDLIDEKIAAAHSRLSSTDCLFCPLASPSLDANLTHMSCVHSFFIPDAEYLVDITGLITYLGEKIAVGNVCIYCSDRSRDFRTLEAVWKHMVDKSHCKIAYDSEADRLEVSDFYDFSSSYPDEEGWVDDESGEPADDHDVSVNSISCSEDDLPKNQITYGDSTLELVLPSGARIGHRSLRHYYGQNFSSTRRGGRKAEQSAHSGAAIVRRLLADKNSALVPRKGGFGAFGSGTEVVRARNPGEAREAGRHVREFRDQKRREDFKTKVGMIQNSQKHFRDPLLQ